MWAPAIAVVLLLAAQGTAPPAGAPAQDPAALAPVPPLPLPAFDVWLAELRAEAEARGIRPDVLERALTGIEPVAQILERDRTQAEFTYSLDAYLSRRLTPRTVRTAREMHRKHRALVERVGKTYGVDPRLLIAVWGLESNSAGSPACVPRSRRWRRWPTIRAAARCSAPSSSTRSRSSTAATSSSNG